MPVMVQAQGTSPPQWFTDHLADLVQGSGRWVADNGEFKSEEEPYDAYLTEWRYGLGNATVTGRLAGIRDGEESGDFWRFRVYWDGAAKTGVIQQFNADGVVGIGSMTAFGDTLMSDQTFTAPDGTQWRETHLVEFEENAHTTESYRWSDGAWVKNRSYRWLLENEAGG